MTQECPEKQIVKVKVSPLEGGDYEVSVAPWSVRIRKSRGDQIEWVGEGTRFLMVQFDHPEHFYNPNPIWIDGWDNATSGPVSNAAPPGTYKYTIHAAPEANRILKIDPDYMLEEGQRS